MISLDDYFAHGRATGDEPAQEVKDNAAELLAKVNAALAFAAADGIECAKAPRLNSGWRPAAYNATVHNAAVHSRHITGQATDVADPDGLLDAWSITNLDVLERLGLWLEHPGSTKGWTHWQCVPPASGNRMFWP